MAQTDSKTFIILKKIWHSQPRDILHVKKAKLKQEKLNNKQLVSLKRHDLICLLIVKGHTVHDESAFFHRNRRVTNRETCTRSGVLLRIT